LKAPFCALLAPAPIYGFTNARFSSVRLAIGFRNGWTNLIHRAPHQHLLPPERKAIIPQLRSHLSKGRVPIIRKTPSRWFPVE
jgi:hypothetical protein